MTVFGLKLEVIVIILFALCICLAVLLFIMYRKLTAMSRKYYALTNGSQGADLENIILARFKEIDKLKKYVKKLHKEHKEIRLRADSCICKTGVVKYDAFDNLTGDLSFSVALLDRESSGVVLSSMHSKEGCYTYAKEIIKGKSYVNLSEEEKEAIAKALTIDEEINNLMRISEDNDSDFHDTETFTSEMKPKVVKNQKTKDVKTQKPKAVKNQKPKTVKTQTGKPVAKKKKKAPADSKFAVTQTDEQ